MAFVIVTAPYPAGSKQSISPPTAVFEIAPAKVLHGAVRLHGLASSPTPDTHVRVACASATAAKKTQSANTAKTLKTSFFSFIRSSLRRLYEQRMYRRGELPRMTKPLRQEDADKCQGLESYDCLGLNGQFLVKNFWYNNDKKSPVSVTM